MAISVAEFRSQLEKAAKAMRPKPSGNDAKKAAEAFDSISDKAKSKPDYSDIFGDLFGGLGR